MNTESLRNEVLVPAVAKTLDIAAKAKPTKPLNPNSILISEPKSPASIPKGIPKLRQRHGALPVVFFYFYHVIPLNKGFFLAHVGCVFINSETV